MWSWEIACPSPVEWFFVFCFSLQGMGGREVGLGALWGSPFSQKQEKTRKRLNSMFPLIVLNTKILKT
jgi:hypothetical protein